jgi:pimeloyl-ACP methyl ester carboxylesterase
MAADRATWRADSLGPAKEVEVRGGRLRYHEIGNGPAIVFVHGVLVNANLWRKAVPALARDFRCVTLDLPMGAHLDPMPNADLTPPGVANLIADAIEALGLEDVTLVGNDTGGAICQLVVTSRPERIGRLVLTSCDLFEKFPPGFFKYVFLPVQVPALVPLLFGALRFRAPRRLPIAFGWVTKRPIDREAEDSYVLPVLTRGEIRRDLARVAKGIDPRYTMEAGERLKEFDRPALIAWSREDKLFPQSDAERLAAALPNARIEWIEDAYTFSAEDQPERLAELIAGFAREPRPERAAAT